MGGSGRFRAAGLSGGGVVGAIRNGVGEFLLTWGELFCFVDSVENICFVANCFGFLDCWKIVRTNKYALGGRTASFENEGQVVE